MVATPPLALSASPARVTLAVHETRTIRVTNAGRSFAVVDVVPAGYALGLRGRPRIVRGRGEHWLRIRPRHVRLEPGGAASVSVSSAAPPGPGDHAALVLLRTAAGARDRITVRMQIGVVVVLRVPGVVVHRLRLRCVRAGRRGGLELAFRNDGNVGEHLGPSRVRVTLRRQGRIVAKLQVAPRELLPHTNGIAAAASRRRLRGAFYVKVEVSSPGGGLRVLRRTFRLRL